MGIGPLSTIAPPCLIRGYFTAKISEDSLSGPANFFAGITPRSLTTRRPRACSYASVTANVVIQPPPKRAFQQKLVSVASILCSAVNGIHRAPGDRHISPRCVILTPRTRLAPADECAGGCPLKAAPCACNHNLSYVLLLACAYCEFAAQVYRQE